jgi:hypothetical protein
VPLTAIVAPLVQDGIRTRMLHDPLIEPDRVSVLVSLTGKLVVWVTVMPRCVQFSTDGVNRFTLSVVPL